MATISTHVLGPTETQVMNIAWLHHEALTVRQVHKQLASRNLAYTTVMTVMESLAEKAS